METNTEIRSLLNKVKKESGVFSYQVAYSLGVNDVTFSRWLRRELSPAQKEQVVAAIKKLAYKGGNQQ